MINQFRLRYPQGCIITELLAIDHGKYIVRTLIQIDELTLATGLAGAETIEKAEDVSRNRALELLDLTSTPKTSEFANTSHIKSPSSTFSTPPSHFNEQSIPDNEQSIPDNAKIPPSAITSLLNPTHRKENKSISSPKSIVNSTVDYSSQKLPEAKNINPIPPDINKNFPQDNVQEISNIQPEKIKPNIPEEKPIKENANPLILELEMVTETPAIFDESNISLPLEEATIPLKEVIPIETSIPEKSAPPSHKLELDNSDNVVIDWSDIIAKTNMEIKRIGWNSQQGKEYLLETYGKPSRNSLTDEEMLQFLSYLESLPSLST